MQEAVASELTLLASDEPSATSFNELSVEKDLSAHGVLCAGRQAAIKARVIREVILPLGRSLVEA